MSDAAAATPAAVDAAPQAAEATPEQAVKPLEAAKWEGIEYTVKGQKRREADPDRVRRLVERGAGFESELENVARSKAELAPLAELRQLLESGDEEAIERALEGKLGQKLDKIAERRIIRQLEREDQYKGMSERERKYAEALEAERAEKNSLLSERQKAEQSRLQQAEQAEVAKYQGVITEGITKTLDALKLPPKIDALAASFIKPLLQAEFEAGVMLTPDDRAEKVSKVLTDIHEWRLTNLDGEALLSALGPGVGRKVQQALLARLEGGTSKPMAAQQQPLANQTQKQAQSGQMPTWDPRRIR